MYRKFLNELEKCMFGCYYPKEMRKLKKKLTSKKIISLKIGKNRRFRNMQHLF